MIRVRSGCEAVSLERKNGIYSVYLKDGTAVEADAVVASTPAYATAELLKDLDCAVSKTLLDIPYPSVAVVCLGYKKNRIGRDLNGFGFLIPHREKRMILGTLWDSSIFPNRAPEGYVLLRTILGGARASALALQDEKGLIDTVTGELREIMGIAHQPDFVRVYVHEKAIPQYTQRHQERLRRIDDFLVPAAQEKLRAYGIAPPLTRGAGGAQPLTFMPRVDCPRCGSAGSERIISSTLQPLVNVVDGGMSLGDAVSRPRVLWGGNQDRRVWLELAGEITPERADALAARGYPTMYRHVFPGDPANLGGFGCVNAVQIDHERGVFVGVGDPRREGTAAGVPPDPQR